MYLGHARRISNEHKTTHYYCINSNMLHHCISDYHGFSMGAYCMKKCKVCKVEFTPTYNSMQKVCSLVCAKALCKKTTLDEAKKKDRARMKKKREALKTLGEHKRELQTIFNEFIRLRDKDDSCISCQRHHEGQYHAGHYITVGARPNLRYDENNCHKQCAPCNNHLSGNLINYRINLIDKIGLEEVVRLECDHEPKHYTIADIEALKKHYRAKVKELKAKALKDVAA